MNFEFEFADKSQSKELLPSLFEILYANMSRITPSDKTKEEELDEWYSNVYPAMQKPQRQIVLMLSEGKTVGFFQYYVNEGRFVMEEIQIVPEWQKSGLFGALYTWLLPRLEGEISFVEAYAHEKNSLSMAILEHLGLVKQSRDGEFYFYRTEYEKLLKKYL